MQCSVSCGFADVVKATTSDSREYPMQGQPFCQFYACFRKFRCAANGFSTSCTGSLLVDPPTQCGLFSFPPCWQLVWIQKSQGEKRQVALWRNQHILARHNTENEVQPSTIVITFCTHSNSKESRGTADRRIFEQRAAQTSSGWATGWAVERVDYCWYSERRHKR